LYVFFHHTLFSFGILEKNSLLGKIFSFGQEAVMVFFLLSGYVIAMSVSKRHYTFREYFKHRFFRIYPIVVVAWIVSFVGLSFSGKSLHVTVSDIFFNILMLQDVSALKPGVFANPLFGNPPLWSLSYEWWFYMLFFLHFFLYKKYFNERLALFNITALLISLIAQLTYSYAYNQVSLITMYYYVWFSGAMVFFLLANNALNKRYILMLVASYFVLLANYFFFFIDFATAGKIGVHPLLEFRHYAVSILGLLFALFFYKYLHGFFVKNYLYGKLVQLLASIAPISFGIYVLHYPIKNYFMQYTEINAFLLLGSTLALSVLMSYFAEIKIYGYIRQKV